MPKLTLVASCLLTLLLSSSPALANDTAMGVQGATVFPLRNKQVRMVREHIRWSGRLLKHRLVGWDVRCEFEFKNTSKKRVDVLIGFPLRVKGDSDVNTLPGQKEPKTGQPLVVGFRTTVRGKVVKAKRKNVSKNPNLQGYDYSFAYVFSVRFKPGETVKIVHTYRGATTVDSTGGSHLSYVLKTGALWNGGRIGRSVIEVAPNIPFKLCSNAPKWMPVGSGKPTPPGYRLVGKREKRKFVWDLKNLAPTQDVELCILTPHSMLSQSWSHGPLSSKVNALDKLSKADLGRLRNTVYAQLGYRFKSQALADYFNKQWWYFPAKSYKPGWLSKAQTRLIARIRKLEQGR